MKSGRSTVGETIKTIVYAVLIALVIRTFLFEPFNIPSGSMKPTLLVGDYLFVSKYSYGYSKYSFPLALPLVSGRIPAGAPERGDVVVFKLPTDTSKDYIKRIMGLPGDKIQVRDGTVYINGEAVKRERIEDEVAQLPGGGTQTTQRYRETLPSGRTYVTYNLFDHGVADDTGVYEVPPDHYFAMGDNRDDSIDSRFQTEVGFIPAENLVGRAEIIFFSTDGTASLLQPWKWFSAIRYGRLGLMVR